jgi:hypothetical protein
LVGIGDDDAPPIAEGDVFRDSEHHGVAKNVALYDVACNSNPIAFNAESVVSCGSESTERRHSWGCSCSAPWCSGDCFIS